MRSPRIRRSFKYFSPSFVGASCIVTLSSIAISLAVLSGGILREDLLHRFRHLVLIANLRSADVTPGSFRQQLDSGPTPGGVATAAAVGVDLKITEVVEVALAGSDHALNDFGEECRRLEVVTVGCVERVPVVHGRRILTGGNFHAQLVSRGEHRATTGVDGEELL